MEFVRYQFHYSFRRIRYYLYLSSFTVAARGSHFQFFFPVFCLPSTGRGCEKNVSNICSILRWMIFILYIGEPDWAIWTIFSSLMYFRIRYYCNIPKFGLTFGGKTLFCLMRCDWRLFSIFFSSKIQNSRYSFFKNPFNNTRAERTIIKISNFHNRLNFISIEIQPKILIFHV